MKPNNILTFLELFQKQDEFHDKIFNDASEVRKKVQIEYKKSPLLFNNGKEDVDGDNNFWVFDFNVDIQQVSGGNAPSDVKLFIRRYFPRLDIYMPGNYVKPILSISNKVNGSIFDDIFENQITPKEINELYVGESISQYFFYEIAKQALIKKTAFNFFNSNNWIKKINELLQNPENVYNAQSKSIIHLNSKLFNQYKTINSSPAITFLVNYNGNLFDRLKSTNNFVIIGSYLSYMNEDELINDIDANSIFGVELKKYFQNDFLFLNNMEFMNETPYTIDWPDIIFSPNVLEMPAENLVLKNSDSIEDTFYIYQKAEKDGMFFRNEFFVPKNLRNSLNDIISISTIFIKPDKKNK